MDHERNREIKSCMEQYASDLPLPLPSAQAEHTWDNARNWGRRPAGKRTIFRGWGGVGWSDVPTLAARKHLRFVLGGWWVVSLPCFCSRTWNAAVRAWSRGFEVNAHGMEPPITFLSW